MSGLFRLRSVASCAAALLVGCNDDARPPLLDEGGRGGRAGAAGSGAGGAGGAAGLVPERSGLVASVPLGLYESEPHLARGPKGELAAVFISLAGRKSVALATSRDDGATWSTLSLLEDPDGREGVDPAVAFDPQGGLVVAFLGLRYDQSGNRSDRRVFVVQAPSIDGPLSPPETLDDGAGTEALDKPWVAAAPGGVLVTWTSDTGAWVRAARRGAGGAWARSTIMPDGQLRALSYPCVSGERAHVAYLTPSGVFVSSSDDGGLTFPAARTAAVSAPGEAAAFLPPSCVADGERVWVAYGTQGAGGTELQAALAKEVLVARSDDGGRSFEKPLRAMGPGAFLNPQLARDEAGRLAVVAYAQKEASSGAVQAALSPDGGAFLPAQGLFGPLQFDRSRTGFGWLGDYLGVSLQGGRLRVILVDNATTPGATLSRVRYVAALAP